MFILINIKKKNFYDKSFVVLYKDENYFVRFQ